MLDFVIEFKGVFYFIWLTMSKIVGLILIILSLLNFFNGFTKNSDFLINWFGPLAVLWPFVIAVIDAPSLLLTTKDN